MPIRALLTVGLLALLLGGTCLPIVDNTVREVEAARTLAIAISQPSENVTVAQGDVVRIEWAAANTTDEPATVSILVESRTDELKRTTLVRNEAFKPGTAQHVVAWDTTKYAGQYVIIARITTASDRYEAHSKALVTVDTTPKFRFTAPTADVVYYAGEQLRFEWVGGDNDGTVTVALDPDDDPDNGNELGIVERDLPNPAEDDTFDWGGKDLDNTDVPLGEYALRAYLKDGVNEDQTVTGTARVTIATPTAFSFTAPAENTDFFAGDTLTITWQGGTQAASARIGLDVDDNHAGGNEIYVAERTLPLPADEDSFEWDGKDLDATDVPEGDYKLFAIVTEGDHEDVTISATATIAVMPLPTFAFTAPTADVEYAPGDTLDVAWNASGADLAARVALDPDADHDNENEITLNEPNLPADPADGTFTWSGASAGGTAVVAGEYTLFAQVADGERILLSVDGVHVTVTTAAESGLVVAEPAKDTEFLPDTDAVAVVYRTNSSADNLVDVKLDTDDDHANGNELTILSQALVAGDTTPEPFQWTGVDADGATVRDGIFQVFAVASSGTGTPQTAEAPGLVLRRSTAERPLVGVLEPAKDVTVAAGEYVTIRWRDDDPTDKATIRVIALGSGGTTELLSDRAASADGVQDTFAWQVPGTLAAGTYAIVVEISAGPDDDAPLQSEAAGEVTIE